MAGASGGPWPPLFVGVKFQGALYGALFFIFCMRLAASHHPVARSDSVVAFTPPDIGFILDGGLSQ